MNKYSKKSSQDKNGKFYHYCLCNSNLFSLLQFKWKKYKFYFFFICLSLNQNQAKDFLMSFPGKLTSGPKPNRKTSSGNENNSLSYEYAKTGFGQDSGENSYVAFNLADHCK